MAQIPWGEIEIFRDKPYKMKAKRNGECAECETELFEGEEIVWDPKEFKAYCLDCGEEFL